MLALAGPGLSRPVRSEEVKVSLPTTEALAAMLDRAMDAARVLDQRHGMVLTLMPLNTYRSLLRSLRESYDPTARMYTASLRPVVQDAEIKGQLTDVISANLREYIHDGQIQSAVLATVGGSTSGFTIDGLLEHWLDIAIARGSEYAADAFLTGVRSREMRYQKMTVLKGARTDREITVSNGVRLVPLPNSAAGFPHYLPAWDGPIGPRPADFALDTVLVEDVFVSPVFVNPTETVDDGGTFTYRDASGNPIDFIVSRFCEALSLVTGGAVQFAAWWSHLDEDHICNVRTSYGGGGYRPDTLWTRSSGSFPSITEETAEAALSLYRDREALPSTTATRLDVAVDRWVRSQTDTLLVDKFIDLGIALESLYLSDGNTSELRFRLALRAAWHLGASSSERVRLMQEFGDVYKLRSKAVHAGSVDDRADTRGTLASAQQHCRRAIVKFITDGGFPEWDRLVVN